VGKVTRMLQGWQWWRRKTGTKKNHVTFVGQPVCAWFTAAAAKRAERVEGVPTIGAVCGVCQDRFGFAARAGHSARPVKPALSQD
jgi:hypothetical protein